MSNSEQLIPLAEIKTHLRLDVVRYDGQDDDLSEDTLLINYRAAALEYASKYCDKSFVGEISPNIKQACLMLIGDFYKFREETQVGEIVTAVRMVGKLLDVSREDMGLI